MGFPERSKQMEPILRAIFFFQKGKLKKMLLIKNDGHMPYRVYMRKKKLGWLPSFIISL
jgi:hypothetical protein